jgi:hypothetical protein
MQIYGGNSRKMKNSDGRKENEWVEWSVRERTRSRPLVGKRAFTTQPLKAPPKSNSLFDSHFYIVWLGGGRISCTFALELYVYTHLTLIFRKEN